MTLNNDIQLSIGKWLDGDLSDAELNALATDIRERRHGKKLASKVLSKGKRTVSPERLQQLRATAARMREITEERKLKLMLDASA